MYEIIVGRDETDRKKFGTKGVIFLGKQYVKMGQTTSLSNKVFMDINRAHIVTVCGKRGCLTEDTLIFTNRGFKKIKDFNEKEDKIYSFDKKHKKFEVESAKLLKYNINNEKLIELELEDGQKIILTKEHPLLTYNNKKGLLYKITEDLTTRDLLIGVTKTPINTTKTKNLRISRLLGFMLADGTMQTRKGKFKDGRGYWYKGTKARLRFNNQNKNVLQRFKEDLENEFDIKAKRYERKDCNCEVIETKHQKIIKKFNKLGVPKGKKSNIIRIPEIIWQSSLKSKSEFIKALFSCDGHVDKKGIRIEYYSNSKKILIDLYYLLKEFNIQSKVQQKKCKCNGKRFISYRLTITDHISIENFKKIGFFDENKQKRLLEHKFHQVKRRKQTKYINDHLFCTKIKKIKHVKNVKEVYDLRVKKNNSFIANGIISHNSGKSYSLGVMAEEMINLPKEISKNLSVLILDTMGIFWTMKYPNTKETSLLEEWNLKPKQLQNIQIFTPIGYFEEHKKKGIPTDKPFAINPSDLTGEDWCNVFDVLINNQLGILIERTISELTEQKKDYAIADIIKKIEADKKTEQKIKNAAENRFKAAEKWGLFSNKATPIKEIIDRGKVTVLDVSCYTDTYGTWSIRGLVIGLIARKLFSERMVIRKKEELDTIKYGSGLFGVETKKEEMPIVWILLDEAHEMLPKDRVTAATNSLIQVLREGRQPGISLVLATQQPGQMHQDVLTQSDIVISHRITSRVDIEALNSMMQTYLLHDLQRYLNQLPKLKGSAVILDDNSERMCPMRVRPRFTWHGGEAPTALKKV